MKSLKSITMHITMLKRVLTYVNDPANIAITESILAFEAAITALGGNVTNLDNLFTQYVQILKGIAAQKKQAKITLAQNSFPIMSAVRSYALANSNPILAEQMKASLSELTRTKYQTLAYNMNQAISAITPIIGDLSQYNITLTMLSEWEDELTAYNAILQGPQVAIAARKALGEQIETVMQQTMTLLQGQTDTLATSFILTQPQYYANYRNNRKLINFGHMSTQLRLTVKNQLEQPVTSGEVYIIGTDRSAALNNNGYALIDYIPFGEQSITLTTPSGTTTYGPYRFKKGKSLTLHVTINTTSSAKSKATIIKEELVETSATTKAAATR